MSSTAPTLERVRYEVSYRDQHYVALTMGEAVIIACELVGDDRFTRPILPSPRRGRAISAG